MKRREFTTLLDSATAWQPAVCAQQGTAVPVVGFLALAWSESRLGIRLHLGQRCRFFSSPGT
jgi:hypothetical protein